MSTWVNLSPGNVVSYGHFRQPKLFQWHLLIIAMLLVSIAFKQKHFSVIRLVPLTLQAAVETTFQFMFITYLGLFGFLTFKLLEVTNSHSCSFTFLIPASEYIFFLWHVGLKDMI